MKAVYWDEEGNEIRQGDENFDKTKWYDYDNNRWANAVVTIDGVESYFVWIPRYKYKINYNTEGTPENGGTIDVKFIDKETTTTDDGYIIHPAFIDDSGNNYENGGWDKELSGIWVGKFETSLVSKTNSNIGITSGTDIVVDESNNTDKTLVIKNGVSAWRNATIGNQYTSAKAFAKKLNSHMLKNTEWGTVAYLTDSEYGRNGERLTPNKNSNYYTGGGINDSYKTNINQSTTGNITGIYDLGGGAYDRVAMYYSKYAGDNYSKALKQDFESETNKKFLTIYTGTDINLNYKKGDATYETKKWYGERADFISSNACFLWRGGYYSSSGSGGTIFYFMGAGAGPTPSVSFHMCLAI